MNVFCICIVFLTFEYLYFNENAINSSENFTTSYSHEVLHIRKVSNQNSNLEFFTIEDCRGPPQDNGKTQNSCFDPQLCIYGGLAENRLG